MQRRRFLETTFAGGLGLGASACAHPSARSSEVPLDDDELERKLGHLDKVLGRMEHRKSREWFLSRRAGELHEQARHEQVQLEGDLVRASLRSALVTSTIAELPTANHSDPRVLERLQAISGEADFAVFGMLEKLRNMDASEREALDLEFASEPALGKQVVEDVDALAAELEVPASRRLHLRRMASHISWRLERERMSSLIDDVVGKVDEALALAQRHMSGLGGMQPAYASGDPQWIDRTRVAVAFYAGERRANTLAGLEPPADAAAPIVEPASEPVQPESTTPVQPAPSDPSETQLPNYAAAPASTETFSAAGPGPSAGSREQKLKKATRMRNAGFITFGVGLGVGVIGIATLLTSVALGVGIIGAVAITAGAIMLTVGIVLAAIGATRKRRLERQGV